MQSAETVLDVLRERGRRGLPCDELYRQLFNPQLYLLAYGRLYSNQGAMTPGVDAETADDMSLEKIGRIIDALRHERYRFKPVKRVYIPKRNGKRRPLGMPSWSDKLVGEVLRLLLEAYYEPQFSDRSHGFRPGRGCHSALRDVAVGWTGTTWFIEGDISRCFDRLDHQVMVETLGEKIHDNRFLRLISQMLQAGYLEDWVWNATLSGVPQGGVLSPCLSNIYLHVCPQGKRSEVEGRFVIRAVPVMEVGPPGSPCRRGAQTTVVSCRSKAGVGSDYGKGSLTAGQVCDEKTNVVEPLLTHRKIMTASQPGSVHISGRASRLCAWCSQRAACVSLWWCSVLRWRELVVGAGMEEENLGLDTDGQITGWLPIGREREDLWAAETVRGRVPRGAGADRLVVASRVL